VLKVAKKWVVEFLSTPPMGYVVGAYYRNRIPHEGCVILTRGPEVAPAVKARLRWGFYERSEMKLLGPYLRTDLDVLELGSSLGVISSHIARRLEQGRRLFCVEANPKMIPLIEANLRENAPDVAWRVLNYAIDYDPSNDSVRFVTDADHVTFHIASDAGSNHGCDDLIEVPTTRLESLLRLCDIEEYVMFSDIEGAEGGILAHDEEALRGCRQLIIELHESQAGAEVLSPDDLADRLQMRYGFTMDARRNDVAVFSR
jgi:FkbM family methyltransferase